MKKLTLVLLLAAFPGTAAEPPVDGYLKVAGKTTKFTNAYAFLAEGFFDKEKNDTIVVLSSGPITEAQLRDEFALRKLARDGKIAFVKEAINPAGQIINFTIGHSAFRMAPSGGSTEHLFEGKTDGKTIRGKVRTRDPQKSLGDVVYEYSATFSANVLPRK